MMVLCFIRFLRGLQFFGFIFGSQFLELLTIKKIKDICIKCGNILRWVNVILGNQKKRFKNPFYSKIF